MDDLSSRVEAVSLNDAASKPKEVVNGNVNNEENASEVEYVVYESEYDMPDIIKLIQKDLSEPYSVYTYRSVKSCEIQ